VRHQGARLSLRADSVGEARHACGGERAQEFAPGDEGRASGITSGEELSRRRVLLVNDVVTTGAGMAALARLVEHSGAEIAGAAWFASRSPVTFKG
jgi:hypothetical protein